MPHGDRTGPMGIGRMTGRGRGFCTGCDAPGFINTIPGIGIRGWGHGRGWGFGMGMGWRCGWGFQNSIQKAYYPQVDELSSLKNQVKYYEDALRFINERISEFEIEKK